jgi:hypothetical protein
MGGKEQGMSTANMDLTEPQVVIHIMSAQIMTSLRAAASEQRWPAHSGDEMDNVIQDAKTLAAEMRELRERYENVYSRVL